MLRRLAGQCDIPLSIEAFRTGTTYLSATCNGQKNRKQMSSNGSSMYASSSSSACSGQGGELTAVALWERAKMNKRAHARPPQATPAWLRLSHQQKSSSYSSDFNAFADDGVSHLVGRKKFGLGSSSLANANFSSSNPKLAQIAPMTMYYYSDIQPTLPNLPNIICRPVGNVINIPDLIIRTSEIPWINGSYSVYTKRYQNL